MAMSTEALLKVLHRLYQLLKKNDRKCHRYNKKTLFDILGVVYERTIEINKLPSSKNNFLGLFGMLIFSSANRQLYLGIYVVSLMGTW